MLNSALVLSPVVKIENGRAITNSRDVAQFFGKEHDNVLKRIDQLVSQVEGRVYFNASSYLAENGKQERCVDMDRDAFTLLAMGFTGAKALHFKLLYIAAFNAMEAQLMMKAPESTDLILADIRENTVAVRCCLEGHSVSITNLTEGQGRIETTVSGLVKVVAQHDNILSRKTKAPSDETRAEALGVIRIAYGGFAPDGSGKRMLDAITGVKLDVEFDHYFSPFRNGAAFIWPIPRELNRRFRDHPELRIEYRPQFDAYQMARQRLFGHQPTLF